MRGALVAVAAMAIAAASSSCRTSHDDGDRPRIRADRSAASVVSSARPNARAPRILFVRVVDGTQRLFAAPADGSAEPTRVLSELPGAVRHARTIGDGRVALVLVAEPAGARFALYRVDIDDEAVRLGPKIAGDLPDTLVSVSDDGSTALLTESTSKATQTVFVLRPKESPKPLEITLFRHFAGGDVLEDGSAAVIGGTPVTCTGPVAACPMEVWRARFASGSVKLEPIATGGTDASSARYLPRFWPGSAGARIVYQSTEYDPSTACMRDLNRCRHDLLVYDDGAGGGLFHAHAVGASFSRFGAHLAFMDPDEPETKCTGLPCATCSLYVGDRDSAEFKRIAPGEVWILGAHAWSRDEQWIAWTKRGGVDPKLPNEVRVARADGSSLHTVGEGTAQGWIR